MSLREEGRVVLVLRPEFAFRAQGGNDDGSQDPASSSGRVSTQTCVFVAITLPCVANTRSPPVTRHGKMCRKSALPDSPLLFGSRVFGTPTVAVAHLGQSAVPACLG